MNDIQQLQQPSETSDLVQIAVILKWLVPDDAFTFQLALICAGVEYECLLKPEFMAEVKNRDRRLKAQFGGPNYSADIGCLLQRYLNFVQFAKMWPGKKMCAHGFSSIDIESQIDEFCQERASAIMLVGGSEEQTTTGKFYVRCTRADKKLFRGPKLGRDGVRSPLHPWINFPNIDRNPCQRAFVQPLNTCHRVNIDTATLQHQQGLRTYQAQKTPAFITHANLTENLLSPMSGSSFFETSSLNSSRVRNSPVECRTYLQLSRSFPSQSSQESSLTSASRATYPSQSSQSNEETSSTRATSHQAQEKRRIKAERKLKREALFKVGTVLVDLHNQGKLPEYNNPVDVINAVNNFYTDDDIYISTREISTAVKNGKINVHPEDCSVSS